MLISDMRYAEILGDTFTTLHLNMGFLVLLYKHIAKLSPTLQNLPRKKLIQRHIGDLAVADKSEVLVPYAGTRKF